MKSFPGYVGRTGAKYEWGYNTSAISGLNDRKFRIPAAKVVGGGSVINGMFYTRGSKEDYDSWEKLGNPGWGWEDLRKWFNKVCMSLHKKVMGVKEGGWSKRNFGCIAVCSASNIPQR